MYAFFKRLWYKSIFRKASDTIPNFSLDGYRGWAKIVNVYDGDTFRACVYIHDRILKFTFRPLGYDAPEMKPRLDTPNRDIHKKNAVIARDLFKEYIGYEDEYTYKGCCFVPMSKPNGLVYIECFKNDKYGRTLVNVYRYKGGKSINDMMIDSGLVLRYDGKTKAEFEYKA